MKALKLIFIILILLTFNLCENECEKSNVGTVEVCNFTGHTIFVNVTSNIHSDERLLLNNERTFYTLSAGVVICSAYYYNTNVQFNDRKKLLMQCSNTKIIWLEY